MTIQVKPIYAEVYRVLQENIDEVLRDHALKQLEQRITEAQRRVEQWEAKFHCDYPTFAERTSMDIEYVEQLNVSVGTQDWEGDLFEWEVDYEDLQRWQQHLQMLLTAS